MTVAPAIARVVTNLNATSTADLMFWTEAELYSWLSEELRRMSREAQLFAEERTVGAPAVAALQALDALDLAVMHVAWNGISLRPVTLAELDALDESWPTAVASPAKPPKYFAPDYQGVGKLLLHPPPEASAAMHLITLRGSPELTAGAPTIEAPEVLGDVLEARTLQAARGRQGDGAMPEVAEALGGLAEMLEGALRALYGGSQ